MRPAIVTVRAGEPLLRSITARAQTGSQRARAKPTAGRGLPRAAKAKRPLASPAKRPTSRPSTGPWRKVARARVAELSMPVSGKSSDRIANTAATSAAWERPRMMKEASPSMECLVSSDLGPGYPGHLSRVARTGA